MSTEKIKVLFDFPKKSKIKAGDGLDEGNFPFYTSSSILKKRVNKAQHFEDALIFGTGGSASVHFADEPFATSTDCIVATSKDKLVNTKFVYYYLYNNIHLLEQGFKGAGLKHISKNYIENIEIPVLPPEAQNKIVSVLEKLDELISKRKQIIQLLDELLVASFLDMFGDMLRFENRWRHKTISEFCDIQGGLQVTPKRESNPISMQYLRVANVYRGYLNLNEIKSIRVTETEAKRTLLRKYDVLIVEGHGNINEIGRAAIWNSETEEMLHQNHIIRVRTDTNQVSPIFLTEYLNSYSGIYQMKSITNTTSGLHTISTGKLKNLTVPIPPSELQQKFENIYNEILSRKIAQNESRIELNYLSKSLAQIIFKNELNFNIDFELDALIREIDLQKKDNDLSKIVGDVAYLQRLVDKLNSQEFTEKELYDKAKHASFQLMETKGEIQKLQQEYNIKSRSIELALK